MRALLALCALAALSAALAACGGAGDPRPPRTASSLGATGSAEVAPVHDPHGYLKSDGDDDPDDHGATVSRDDEQELIAGSSREARPSDLRAVSVAVKRYYAAALAGDGARGCALLERTLAKAIAEDAAHGGGSTCATALSRLFQNQHRYLSAEQPATMVITGVRIEGDVALTTLGFKRTPEGEMILQREGGGWKLDALFDSGLP